MDHFFVLLIQAVHMATFLCLVAPVGTVPHCSAPGINTGLLFIKVFSLIEEDREQERGLGN